MKIRGRYFTKLSSSMAQAITNPKSKTKTNPNPNTNPSLAV